MSPGFIVAIVGAESTGKSTLAAELCAALRAEGRDATFVPEYLREFCDRLRRTPVQSEQAHIAFEQTRRIAAAAAVHELVIADTTALMIAVYSDIVFGDTSLYADAELAHRRCDLTVLTALDLPWQPDVLRDGEHVREPVDAKVRAALHRSQSAYSVVGGSGEARLAAALKVVRRALSPPEAEPGQRWQWVCERCGDVDCERHLLPRG
ncbi:ATP-binding protein [Piscinibacter sp. XHJ-5]|uniref:ATP-binding protein n=1 Tax=Piscinibacter sp. XHJ-5 TaxID=3037797 RepID=UPI002452A783|nr:ATP-binding protein [Piscinibacter sp. XHJ-5]